MKKAYSAPQLVEYGLLEQITLGSGGILPDLNSSFNLINNNCPTATFGPPGATSSRFACLNGS